MLAPISSDEAPDLALAFTDYGAFENATWLYTAKGAITAVTLDPSDIQDTLTTMSYQRQRRLAPSHIGSLADMMVSDEFESLNQITFAYDRDDLVLVDGQHRLHSAITAGYTDDWTVRCLCDKAADQVYRNLDSSVKQRTLAVIARTVGYERLSARIQNVILSAARYQNLWRTDYENPAMRSTPPPRHNILRANHRLEAFEKADRIIANPEATSQIKRKLAAPMVLAIMAETIHSSNDEAVDFWTEVSTNSTGITKQLQALLIEGRKNRHTTNYMARLAGQAWNQRYSKGSLRQEHRNNLKIDQTPFVVKP